MKCGNCRIETLKNEFSLVFWILDCGMLLINEENFIFYQLTLLLLRFYFFPLPLIDISIIINKLSPPLKFVFFSAIIISPAPGWDNRPENWNYELWLTFLTDCRRRATLPLAQQPPQLPQLRRPPLHSVLFRFICIVWI